jgi:hypothetical protein
MRGDDGGETSSGDFEGGVLEENESNESNEPKKTGGV